MFVQGVLRGGVLLVSIYLWHTEGLTDRNRALLDMAGAVISEFGGPWLLAGDFNMEPGALAAEAADWLHRIGGKVVAPTAATCRSANGVRTIDFGVIEARIAAAVHSVSVENDFPASPHIAVRFRLRCTASLDDAYLVKRPKRFSHDVPIGCGRRP